MKNQKTQAERFAECVADAARQGWDVGEKDLDGAVFLLWGTTDTFAEKGKVWRAAKAEVEAMTRGQAFRLDTANGPLFEEFALWRFAGRSGFYGLEDAVSRRRGFKSPLRPTWPEAAAGVAA